MLGAQKSFMVTRRLVLLRSGLGNPVQEFGMTRQKLFVCLKSKAGRLQLMYALRSL